MWQIGKRGEIVAALLQLVAYSLEIIKDIVSGQKYTLLVNKLLLVNENLVEAGRGGSICLERR